AKVGSQSLDASAQTTSLSLIDTLSGRSPRRVRPREAIRWIQVKMRALVCHARRRRDDRRGGKVLWVTSAAHRATTAFVEGAFSIATGVFALAVV
ncbi:MAG: hypothetical protein ACYDA0_15815, partial [Candidatus Dormibacteraceae bacterium]